MYYNSKEEQRYGRNKDTTINHAYISSGELLFTHIRAVHHQVFLICVQIIFTNIVWGLFAVIMEMCIFILQMQKCRKSDIKVLAVNF